MIVTKFIFANLGTLYRLIKKLKANKFLYLRKEKGCIKVLLDQDDCRANFAVSVNLAKKFVSKILVLSPKRLNLVVNFHAAKFSSQI